MVHLDTNSPFAITLMHRNNERTKINLESPGGSKCAVPAWGSEFGKTMVVIYKDSQA